jgi:hypothetical protein
MIPAARPVPIGLGTLATLLAGRGSYRLVQLVATVTLLPLWGTETYGVYAGALAAFSWIVALLVAGPEKTVLKLLPRAPRTGPLIVSAAVAVLCVVPVPLLAAFLASVALGERGTVAIYLGVAAMAATTGALLLLAGLHRAVGRPAYDARTFAVLAAVEVTLVGLVVVGLDPLGYVGCLVAAQTVLWVVLLVRLGRPSLRIRHRPGLVRRVACTVVLMGAPDICLYLAVGVLIALLSGSALRNEVGPLVAVEILWSAGINLLLYVLRVYTPQVSVRLLGARGAAGRHTARRVAAWVVAGDVAYVGVIVVLLATTGLFPAGHDAQAFVLWAALFAARTPMLVGMISAGYLVENTDARSPRITGMAAVAGLTVATAAGLAVVPVLGGVGVLAALAAAEAVQAATVWQRLTRRTAATREPVEEDARARA